jgi:hypothetical protein
MLKDRIKTISPLFLLLFIISVASAEQIPHPPEYMHFLKLQIPQYEEISNKEFWLSRIKLINCIALCDIDPQKIDEQKIAEIEKNA